ncbi:hypothetical protein KUTeg_016098 [Tegillarca granosa]|uniref:Uncharacterized protein n=1 Tax=Tegillarca granosa TaxID=220873 RepID=A0ABQ9EJV6_TEGGR|nr:hypothetical protein KUTeg_016098 [Tegillarca granosa]
MFHAFRDGAIHSGLVCACFTEIERLEIDNEVDIFQTVRQLQIRRPEFIQKPMKRRTTLYEYILQVLHPRRMVISDFTYQGAENETYSFCYDKQAANNSGEYVDTNTYK